MVYKNTNLSIRCDAKKFVVFCEKSYFYKKNVMHVNFLNRKIYYTDKGKGPVLVLLHGFTESSAVWDSFAKNISSEYRVVCIDLPGHGKSDVLSETHSMDLMADAVVTVLHHLKIEKCVLIGHSMGGYVSLAFAEKCPEKLWGLGLFHSTVFADSDEVVKNRLRTNEIVRKNHLGFLSEFIPSLFAPQNASKFKDEISELKMLATELTVEGIIAANVGMASRSDKSTLIKNLNIPLMFIGGKNDSRIPLERMIQQIQMPKKSYSLLLENVGHMGFIEDTEVTLAFVIQFLKVCFN
jgi:pimeloyl-ACP methyl ester carboxylesterase